MTNTHNIIHAGNRYEALDEYGNFICSGDTWNECYDELVDILVSESRAELRMENIRGTVTGGISNGN